MVNNLYRWKVVELVYTQSLDIDDLKVGVQYAVYYQKDQKVLPFKLVEIDDKTKTYRFEPKVSGVDEIRVKSVDLPLIYPHGTDIKAHKVVLEGTGKKSDKKSIRMELDMDEIKKSKFRIDVGKCHVLEAIEHPSNTNLHLCITTPEPYGFCCLEGLKISMEMNNAGGKRWGVRSVDAKLPVNDQRCHIVGDHTKMIRVSAVTKTMLYFMESDTNWTLYFQKVASGSGLPELSVIGRVAAKIMSAVKWFSKNTDRFRRETIKTRLFNVGDNLYLCTEIPNEYIQWRRDIVGQLLDILPTEKDEEEEKKLKESLSHGLDRLWHFSCLEVYRMADVFGDGINHHIPRLNLIDSQLPIALSEVDIGERFSLANYPEEQFEILGFHSSMIVARNVDGHISHSRPDLSVVRHSNLTRSLDGNSESKFGLSTFPVSHFVNHRSIRISDEQKSYVFAFLCDVQASPYFMRPSGLTCACINAISFNAFLENALNGVRFVDRYSLYSKETDWSNGEVVQRGIGGNHREKDFLSLGFSYSDCMDYLFAKVLESTEGDQNISCLLTRQWKILFAAAFIPLGLEFNDNFKSELLLRWRHAMFDKLIRKIRDDKRFSESRIEDGLHTRKASLDPGDIFSDRYWDDLIHGVRVEGPFREIMNNEYLNTLNAVNTVCSDMIDFARKASLYKKKSLSDFTNQPSAADSIVNNFALESQTLANTLTLSAVLGAASFAYLSATGYFPIIFGSVNILIAFYTMTNARRYRIRNEEARLALKDERFSEIRKAIFYSMDSVVRRSLADELNPFMCLLEKAAKDFRNCALYYDYEEPDYFNERYKFVRQTMHDIQAVQSFQKFLIENLITDLYHANSYIQDSLVKIYRILDEIIYSETLPTTKSTAQQKNAKRLLTRLYHFEKRVDKSLQRDGVFCGFIKVRKWYHSDLMITLRYFYSLIWFFPSGGLCCSPIETESYWIFQGIQRYARNSRSGHLHRAAQDAEILYRAIHESDFACLIFVAAGLTLLTSIVFTVATIFFTYKDLTTDLAFYAAAASSVGALLAAYLLMQKLLILLGLSWILSRKRQKINNESNRLALQRVCQVTHLRTYLTLSRLCAVCAAALVLVFSVAEIGYSTFIEISPEVSFWLTFGAIVTIVGSFVTSFCIDYSVCYKLNVDLGPFVCSIFEAEIENLYKEFSVQPTNTIDLSCVQERETWEYTARAFLHKYRFDTIFDADQYGQIFQYILSEMKSLTPV